MSNPVIVVGTYTNRRRAEVDYEHFAKNRDELWAERIYALELVERSACGKLQIVNHLEPDADRGTLGGTVIGGLLGLIYPPLVLIGAVAGAGVGRAMGHLWHGVSRADVQALGAVLDQGEGAVMLIAAALSPDVGRALPDADAIVHREMTHTHEDIQALIEELEALAEDEGGAVSQPAGPAVAPAVPPARASG
jgi:uncharacterized membrane protein